MFRAITLISAMVLFLPTTSFAVPTLVASQDIPNCDPLIVPPEVHELGIAPTFAEFTDELIATDDTETELIACPADDPETPNVLVTMINMTGIAWSDVWYVADPFSDGVGTSISNIDGYVDMGAVLASPGEAFKIDAVGVNKPLITESIAFDGIFAPGEVWEFIIDDYLNSGGIPAWMMDSLGVASASAGGPPSSGSIIAVAVPEPSGLLLLAAGMAVGAIVIVRRAVRQGGSYETDAR